MTRTGGWAPDQLVPVLCLLLASGVVALVAARARAPRTTVVLAGAGAVLLLVGLLGGTGVLPRAVGDRTTVVALLAGLPVACLWVPTGPPRLVGLVAVPLVSVAGATAAVVLDARALGVAELVVATVVVGAVWYRFERGREATPGPARDQLRWLALGLVTTVVLVIPLAFTTSESALVLVGRCVEVLLLPAAAVLACVLPPGRVDIRSVAARTVGLLVSLVLAVAVWSGAVAVLELAGLDATRPVVGAVVAAGVAVGFGAARRVVDRTVDLLLFGERLDPVRAAGRFAAELAAADDPVAVLRALREALGLPSAAVRDESGETVLSSGGPAPGATYVLPLRAAGTEVGALVLGLPTGEVAVPARSRPVLRIVVPALAQLVRARDLGAALRLSRDRVVGAVEEERGRLRRDLHDGLGPTLTGIAYAAGAARNLVVSDPARADAVLTDLRADATVAIGEVRRLVDGLRPAVLDELGLAEALRRHCLQLRNRDGQPVDVTLEVPEDLTGLGPRTELVVFRVVTEALTNVARHSGADRAGVRVVARDDALEVTVVDTGAPDAPTWVPGGGLRSMRERTEQLGGRFAAGAGPDGGRVRVWFPSAAG